MALFATAGAKVFIGTAMDAPTIDDLTAADFTSMTWTEIAPLESIGTFGDSAEAITFDAIGLSRRQKIKGVRDAGTLELVAGIDYADAGQIAAIAAEKTADNYAFKITFNDAPATGTAPAPSQRLFVGMVMSAAEALDAANNIMKLNVSVGINSNIVRVDATTGS